MLELHAGVNQALLVRGDTLLFLDKRLDDAGGVVLGDVQRVVFPPSSISTKIWKPSSSESSSSSSSAVRFCRQKR